MMTRWATFAAIALLMMFCLLSSQEASGYLESHPPFPAGKPIPYAALKAEPVLDYHAETPFADGSLRISTSAERDKVGRVTTVEVDGRPVFDTASAHPDLYLQFGSRVLYTDLTGDGRKDILVYSYPGGNGLGAHIEVADLLIAKPDGQFAHTTFEGFAAGPEDYIDVNGDGRYEMLWVNYFFEGDHSYWVYRIVEIGDDGLRLNDQLIPDFPKIVWFTKKPNDKPTQKLTAAERDDLIRQSTAKWQETYR